MSPGKIRLVGLIACIVAFTVPMTPLGAIAGTLIVTNVSDAGPGSLRQAIADAGSGDLIQIMVAGTITNVLGELVISNNVTIDGPGASALTISGNGANRAFNIISPATVKISRVRLAGCYASSLPGTPTPFGAEGASGGAIINSGNLTLTDCMLTGNSAAVGGPGGQVSTIMYYGGPGGDGGAIWNDGTLTLTSCLISGSYAGVGGSGGIGTTRSDGGNGGNGGGIYNSGVLEMRFCSITGNGAGAGGFGGFTSTTPSSGWLGGYGGSGGGMYNGGTLTMTECTIVGNNAGNGGTGGFGNTPAIGRAAGSGGGRL